MFFDFIARMKPGFWLACVVGWLCLAGTAWAQPQRIAAVNMEKVFDSYWRTKQAQASLRELVADLEKEHRTMLEEMEKAKQEYQKLVEAAADPTLSAEEREKRKAAAEKALARSRELERDIMQHERQARVTVEEKNRRLRANLISDIRATITTVAQDNGYALVVDSSATTPSGAPLFPYASTSIDITELVIRQLNATAPPGFAADSPSPASTNQTVPKR